jgi:hypothetical protein
MPFHPVVLAEIGAPSAVAVNELSARLRPPCAKAEVASKLSRRTSDLIVDEDCIRVVAECLGDGVQACYSARPQRRNDGRKVGRRSIGARYAGFIGDARGAVARVATGRHNGSLPTRPLILLQPFSRVVSRLFASWAGSQLMSSLPWIGGLFRISHRNLIIGARGLFDGIASRAVRGFFDRRIGSSRLRLRGFSRAERRWSFWHDLSTTYGCRHAASGMLGPRWVSAGAADCSRLMAPATRRDVPGP